MPLINVTYKRAVPDRIETLVVEATAEHIGMIERNGGLWVGDGDKARFVPTGQIIEVVMPRSMVLRPEAVARVAGHPYELQTLLGVGDEVAQAMRNAGIRSLDDVRNATDDDLLDISGIGEATLAKIREQVG